MHQTEDLKEIRELLYKKEETLSRFAQKSINSKGRNIQEDYFDPFRTEFQTDKDRIKAR